ncbi:MAG: methyltransferase domain-containing protein [Robiginitalea sp.]|uniref:methyltransferase domain-containing protein n=1 Tax=Robiginitalea sp. TaxID=1902411 RepID=UPI003C7447A5
MSFPSFKKRSNTPELMDDLELPKNELEAALADLKMVNTLLGGHAVGMAGLKPFLSREIPCHILDIGCGDGEFLRHLHKYCSKKGFKVRLTGWDRNSESLEWGSSQNKDGMDIQYEVRDIMEFPQLPEGEFVIICNLFMHHFTDEQIHRMLSYWSDSKCKAIVINDLDRNPLAYYLFRLFGVIFMKSKIAIHDGLISILRGFRNSELKQFSLSMGVTTHQIQWKWAFRYLWILHLKEKE